MPVTPRPPAFSTVSDDAIDKLLGAIGEVTASVQDLGGDVREAATDAKAARRATEELGRRLEVAESKIGRTERDRRSDVLAASTGDEKLANEHAGFVIAVEETRKNSKLAVELARKALEVASANQETTKTIAVENKAQTTAIQVVANEDLKKPKIPVKLAALLNLLAVLGYVFLELLKRFGKG